MGHLRAPRHHLRLCVSLRDPLPGAHRAGGASRGDHQPPRLGAHRRWRAHDALPRRGRPLRPVVWHQRGRGRQVPAERRQRRQAQARRARGLLRAVGGRRVGGRRQGARAYLGGRARGGCRPRALFPRRVCGHPARRRGRRDGSRARQAAGVNAVVGEPTRRGRRRRVGRRGGRVRVGRRGGRRESRPCGEKAAGESGRTRPPCETAAATEGRRSYWGWR
mmetsp:Transcript_102/g.272  ORF Transcript_102/g.272 Transcript_102/m.272 type:complete len:220 (-) Transcript_102:322-981(-)